MMDDPNGATRHLIAREVLFLLIQGTTRFNSEVGKWDEDGNTPAALNRIAWRFADHFVAESILMPSERAALADIGIDPDTEEET